MTTLIKATYHAASKTAQFIADDGRHLLRTGGSLPWRLNNAGNLVSPLVDGKPAPKKTKGFIGFAKAGESQHHFFIFPDYETGRAQLKASLQRKYGDKSLKETIHIYAPSDDNNNTDRYVNDLSKFSGVSASTKISELSLPQLDSVMDGIERIEGYHAKADTRVEKWVTVSHIQATDGTRPIAGEEIVVKSGGKETTLKSNAVGQFPPIVHGKGATEVQHKTADGKLKPLASWPEEKGQHWSLLTTLATYFGVTAPVKPTAKPITKKQPLTYTVKPGDSLSKIAAQFKMSVAQLKQDNRLARDTIMPGQVLGIHCAAPATLAPAKPKTAVPKASTGNNSTAKATPPPSADNKTTAARSKNGSGEPLALIEPEDGLTPWMKYAIGEAKRFRGKEENDIEKTINYHKEIKISRSSLTGTDNAWCASFANWCLLQAGYPIQNPKEMLFVDRVAATARAEGFRNLRGAKTKPEQKYEDVPFVDNPLYEKIDDPIYGAIGVVIKPTGHGSHVGFVYGRCGKNEICLLGGNQGQTIKFTAYAEKELEYKVGKKTKKSNHLEFYLPTAYMNNYKKNKKEIPDCIVEKLNFEIGITTKKKATESTR